MSYRKYLMTDDVPPSELYKTVKLDTDSDTISRRTAISAICNACGKIDCDKMDKCEKLQLPPANSSEIPNSSDTISRKAALEALMDALNDVGVLDAEDINTVFQMLPPAQPKTGKWALQSDDYHEYYECDHCGMAVGLDDVRNFCPNCGAEMEVTT